MRRVFAISLAIAAVMFMAGGVMAQETQQDGNDLLLKILKDRNILTDQEFQEIKGQLAQEKSEVDQQLSALDRSLADYLAKAGDSVGGNNTYVQNRGVTFTSGDGMWSIYFGGLFQFAYAYETGDFVDHSTGGFAVAENRLDFGGTIFDPAMMFYVQFNMNNYWESSSYDSSVSGGFYLLDAYVDYMVCDWMHARAGQFKVPYGRQSQVDQSDRAFGSMNWTSSNFRVGSQGRDVGIMFHNVADLDDNADGMKLEWAAGLWNGAGNNLGSFQGDTWLMWGLRLGLYPMGFIDYVEGDWAGSDDPKFGIAGSVMVDEYNDGVSDDNPTMTAWEVDAVLTWAGLYFTAEYFSNEWDMGSEVEDTGWYIQAGYFIMPGEFELLGRYGASELETMSDEDVTEWALGAAYYFNGHEWKVIGEIGKLDYDDADLDGWFIAFILQADW